MLVRTKLMLNTGIKSFSGLVRAFLREMVEKEKPNKNTRLTGKMLALKVKKFAVKGVRTPVELQDKFINGVRV